MHVSLSNYLSSLFTRETGAILQGALIQIRMNMLSGILTN